MQSFDIEGLIAASSTDEIKRKYSSSISECCGSLFVTDLSLDKTNWGLTLAVNDIAVPPEETEEYIIDTFEIDGKHFNMKFRK